MDPHLQEILGPDPTPFETLISNLMKPSNELRSHAESLFILCKQTDPNTLVEKLVHLLEHSSHLEVRAMSAVLLRNLFKQADPNTLSETTRVSVKSSLLNCVVNEQNKPIIKILGNTISKLSADNGWPELITFMFDLVASEDSRLQESALLIFAQLAQYVGDSLVPHITPLHGVFMNFLRNAGSPDVRIAALSAVINFIQCVKSPSDRDRFQDLLPGMMQCSTEVLDGGNEEMVQKALILLIELAGTEPRFFRGQLVEVFGSMLQIAETESLEEGTRHLAIEFVITLVEARQLGTRMTEKKSPQLISRLFAILIRMLSDIEDEADRNSAENENEDAGESSNYSIGQECLHRLAIALVGDAIVPVVYEQLHAYLTAPDRERQKHLAALVALTQIAKGRSNFLWTAKGRLMVMFPNLEQVVTMVLNSFQDPHPRVRWAAINAIGQLFTYLDPYLQDHYHARVLPALALALYDFQNPRVQGVLDVRLVPAMVRVLTKGQKVTTQEALKLLVEWAHQIKRGWFAGLKHLEEWSRLVSSAIEIAESQSLKKESRHLAIDFLITLGEGWHIISDRELMKLFGILMSDIENEAASHWVDNEDDDVGELRNCSFLLKFLDRMVFSMLKYSVAWPILERYLLASEWQKRVIALVALARISKVFKETKNNFDQLVTMVVDLFQDSHHRVRLAAINAAGQLSTDLNPDLQLQYHRLVLPALAKAIYDFQYPQVQAHAASAVVDISKNFPRDTLTPYLFDIVGTLLEFRRREDTALDQTRILAIENLLKQFRVKLPHDTWASTWSTLLDHQQVEFLFILAHR